MAYRRRRATIRTARNTTHTVTAIVSAKIIFPGRERQAGFRRCICAGDGVRGAGELQPAYSRPDNDASSAGADGGQPEFVHPEIDVSVLSRAAVCGAVCTQFVRLAVRAMLLAYGVFQMSRAGGSASGVIE
jgi:hypothetical protein